MLIPLYMTLCTSLAAFRILSLPFAILVLVCLGVGFIYLVWLWEVHLIMICDSSTWICFVLQVWDISAIISSIHLWSPSLSLPFWKPCKANVGMLNVILTIASGAFIFLNCFPFCCSDWVSSMILSSRSHMCSSVLLSLLFLFLLMCAFGWISDIELLILDGVFLLFSSSLLQCWVFRSVSFSNFSKHFITNILNSLTGKFFYFCSLLINSVDFFCSFRWAYFLCLMILTLSSSMNLGETFTSCALVGVFLCASVPMPTACAQCVWWDGWIGGGCQSHLSLGCAGSYHVVRALD